uniref:hypothetical protein n=1 Tax=Oligella urethralis TaxID=90245 RepID=UPI0006610D77
ESTELANTEQAQLKAGRLDIQTERLENIQSGIVQTGTQALNINSAALTNSGQLGTAVISDPVSSDIDPENPSSGDAPSPTEPGQQTPSSSTALGKTTTETVVSPALAAGRIQVERNITNDEGQISANGDVHLSLSQALHNQGDIQVKNLQSKGEQLRNAGYINAERLDLEHRHLDNRQGHLYSSNAISLATETLDNRAGQISTRDSLLIDNQGRLDNSQGQLLAAQAITLNTQEMQNTQGQLVTGKSLSVSVEEVLHDQQGQWQALEALRIHAGELQSEQSRFSTDDELHLASQGQLVLTEAQLSAQHSLQLQGDGVQMKDTEAFAEQLQVLSSGELQSQGAQWQAQQVQVEAVDWQNLQGEIVAEKDLIIRSNSLDNQQGRLVSGEVMSVQVDQDLTNQQGEIITGGSADLHVQGALVNRGVIAAGETLAIHAEHITQEGGHLQAEQLALKAKQAIAMSDESTVLATESAEFSAGADLSLAGTQIQTLNKLQLQAGQKIVTQDTDLQSQQGDVSLDAKSIVQTNTTLGGNNLALSATDNIQAEDSQWLADSSLQVTSSALDLQRLSSGAQQIKLQANQNLSHQDSVMVAEQSVHLQAVAMTNQGSQIAAGENLLINAGQLLDNQEGALVAQQDLQITASIVTNQQGKLSAQQDLQVTASQSVNNQSGLMVADGVLQLSSPIVINQDGQISAADLVAINNNTNFDNQSGLLVSDGDIRLETSSLENSRGQIHAKGNTTIQASQRITNHGGEILAAKTVSLLDSAQQRNQRRLQIEQDANGVIQGNEGTVLIAQELRSQARIETPGHLQLDVTEGFNNLGGLQAGGSLSLITDKHLHNTQTIYSPDALTVQASDIHNDSTGELLGETAVTVVAKTGDIVNRGLINSNGVTTVEAAGTIDNIGSGRIYGDHVAIQSKTLLNREEVQATGERKAAVIAARERLDIGVHSLRNQEEGLLFSGGDLAIGARLDVNKQAQGQASNLINSAATIESLGDMYLNVHSIRNLNPDFELTRVQVSTPERFDFIVHDGQGYETRVDKKDLKERRWSRRAWEFVSKEPGDYA